MSADKLLSPRIRYDNPTDCLEEEGVLKTCGTYVRDGLLRRPRIV